MAWDIWRGSGKMHCPWHLYTRDMFIRDIRRSGGWFPFWSIRASVCFGKMILCDRKSRRIVSFLMYVVNFENWGNLVDFFRFWCCQVQQMSMFQYDTVSPRYVQRAYTVLICPTFFLGWAVPISLAALLAFPVTCFFCHFPWPSLLLETWFYCFVFCIFFFRLKVQRFDIAHSQCPAPGHRAPQYRNIQRRASRTAIP